MTLRWWKKPPWQKKLQKSHFLASGANLVNFELGEVCFGYTYKHHCCIFLHYIAQGSIGPIILVPRQLCQNMGHSSGHHTFIKCLLCLLRTNICTLLKVGWKKSSKQCIYCKFLFFCLLSHPSPFSPSPLDSTLACTIAERERFTSHTMFFKHDEDLRKQTRMMERGC